MLELAAPAADEADGAEGNLAVDGSRRTRFRLSARRDARSNCSLNRGRFLPTSASISGSSGGPGGSGKRTCTISASRGRRASNDNAVPLSAKALDQFLSTTVALMLPHKMSIQRSLPILQEHVHRVWPLVVRIKSF